MGISPETILFAVCMTGIIDTTPVFLSTTTTKFLTKFNAWVEGNDLLVDEDEIAEYGRKNPQPFKRDEYLGLYADTSHAPMEEDKVKYIEHLAKNGVKGIGHHGALSSMGVPRGELPSLG